MLPADEEKIRAWHEQEKMKFNPKKPWNAQEECETYCTYVSVSAFLFEMQWLIIVIFQDVKILKNGALKYNDISKQYMGIDPLVNCITASEACMASYKTHYMAKDSICIVSDHGLLGENRISKLSETYLNYVEKVNNIVIESSLHGKEKKVLGFKVDGYYKLSPGEILPMFPTLRPNSDIIFEIYGCLFHGCLNCYNKLQREPFSGETMHQRNVKTMIRQRILEEPENHTIIAVWECEIKSQMKEDENFKNFVNNLYPYGFPSPIDVR